MSFAANYSIDSDVVLAYHHHAMEPHADAAQIHQILYHLRHINIRRADRFKIREEISCYVSGVYRVTQVNKSFELNHNVEISSQPLSSVMSAIPELMCHCRPPLNEVIFD
jgi:hypothetical protein